MSNLGYVGISYLSVAQSSIQRKPCLQTWRQRSAVTLDLGYKALPGQALLVHAFDGLFYSGFDAR